MRHDICRKVLIRFESLFLIVILLGDTSRYLRSTDVVVRSHIRTLELWNPMNVSTSLLLVVLQSSE